MDFWTYYVVESSDVNDVNDHGAELGLRDWLTLIRKKSTESEGHYQEGVDECDGPVDYLSNWDDEQCARQSDREPNVSFDHAALVAACADVREQGRKRAHKAGLDAIMERREEWFAELDDEIESIVDEDPDDYGGEEEHQQAIEETKAADANQRRGMDDTIREGCAAFGLPVPEALTS